MSNNNIPAYESINAELRRRAEEAGLAIPEGPAEPPEYQYLTFDEILGMAKAMSGGVTQTEIAQHLEVNQSAVSRAFKGETRYVKLLMRWIEMRYPSVDPDVEFERDPRGEPVRYYRVNYIRP